VKHPTTGIELADSDIAYDDDDDRSINADEDSSDSSYATTNDGNNNANSIFYGSIIRIFI